MNTKQFGDFEPEYCNPETAEVAIVPVLYDGTSTWVKGADMGPQAILNASYNLEFYDTETDSEVFRRGIFTELPVKGFADPEEMVQTVRRRIEKLLEKGKFPVILGGEHSVSIGAVEAVVDRFEGVTVLQLDAHADMRDEYQGSRYNHACVMARVKEVTPIVQIGIRSMDTAEKANMDLDRVFFAHDICDGQSRTWIDEVVSKLTDNVYLTVDLDVFDPSIMPATGTPEPGGMNWYDVTALIQAVCKSKNLIGFDIVELSPRKDLWNCDFLAAKLLYKTLTYKFCLQDQ